MKLADRFLIIILPPTGMQEALNGGIETDQGGRMPGRTNRHRPVDDADLVSVCSTCSSSSSSDEDEDYPYSLPPNAGRRAPYGGVRISYVPNDALALASARQRAQTLQPGASSVSSSSRSNSNAAGDKEKDKNCIIS